MSPETLQVGVVTTIVGMGVVFVVLIFLAFLTAMLARICTAKKKEKAAASVAASAPTEASAEVNRLDAKVVAAIIAAISAATGKPASQLKFTAIKRVHGTHTAWADAGTAEIITTRQNYL